MTTILSANLQVTPRLSQLLAEKGMTQLDLSAITGIPQGTISRFDKNERHVAWHLFAIADALDLRSVDELFIVIR